MCPLFGSMDFSNLTGFDIAADLAPLTALQHAMENSVQSSISPTSQIPENGETDTRKVFFITNCGSLVGRVIAKVALEHGHLVAACAREKHLADLSVCISIECCLISSRLPPIFLIRVS